ncbi:hypothetical protein KV205_31375 [Streptomyces sp. SKN60]|uniref:hypothetical protein n=1 Tax=Streptomyces sp. SKN60 TaxID=2855506 RepID=UPI0022455B8F|nr:hypothetical protein [Streptomyces sp. SKN60]MCX2184992.1 hypothetical protein [Streptomyces sp. SKN60]
MANTGVSVQLTPDGYTVTCPGTRVTGHGPTETDAWNDFWNAYHAQWKPPATLTAPDGLNGPQRRRKILTLRVRDLFG